MADPKKKRRRHVENRSLGREERKLWTPSCTRRQALSGIATALALTGCERFDAMSWVTRERFDVDRRFTESTEQLSQPLPPSLADDSRWSALLISDLHFWDEERNLHLEDVGSYLTEQPVDLLFVLGDIVETGWPVEYEMAFDTLDGLGTPFYTLLGNHDVWHEGWAQFRLHFGPSVYTLHVGNTLIIVLDLAGATLGGLQRPWLEEQLLANTSEHIIMFSHYPLWSPTGSGFSQLGSQQEVYDILGLMRTHGVAAHVSGHTHRWAFTELDGSRLYTISAMKEGAGDRCGLRIDVDGSEISYTRIPFDGGSMG